MFVLLLGFQFVKYLRIFHTFVQCKLIIYVYHYLPQTSPSSPTSSSTQLHVLFFCYYELPLNPTCTFHMCMDVLSSTGAPTIQRGHIPKGEWLSFPLEPSLPIVPPIRVMTRGPLLHQCWNVECLGLVRVCVGHSTNAMVAMCKDHVKSINDHFPTLFWYSYILPIPFP